MQLNYQQYSKSGKPLLILHGLFGSLGNWGWHSKQFADKFAVIGADLRNHGESAHSEEMDYPAMAQDIRQLLATLVIDSAYFIGHSMGGKVAMQLALNFPDLVDKLIIVDIAPVTYPASGAGHGDVLDGMRALDFAVIKSRADAESELTEFIQDEPTRKFILTNLVREESGRYAWRLNLRAIQNNYDELRQRPSATSSYNKPVLFVKGADSAYIQARNDAAILELFPNAKVKTIMQAGHWLHAEKPQAFQKIALDFLL
ncbi:MAG: alpha/beta fold hydrolase [Proteobacteria bacterium]|nr:alpha/beta fold hydrolase [Pseudomonadota bacterium]